VALADRKDPYLSFRFIVEIDGLVVGGFSEVSGLQVEVEIESYREGGLNEYLHELPGATKYPARLVLKRGFTDSDVLWKWHRDVVQGIVERKNGSIVLFDTAGAEQWRWNFFEAFPVRWVGPDLRGGTAEVAVETLELSHRGLSKAG
jgi:phage tail-like protein